MNITLTGKKGRSTITNEIDISDLKTEEGIQEVVLEFFDFLVAMGAELPEELIEMLDEFDDYNN
jgi:hypothetical protein